MSFLVIISALVLFVCAISLLTTPTKPNRLLGLTTLIMLVTVGIYGRAESMRLLASAVAFLWMSALVLPPMVRQTRWGAISLRGTVASALILTALIVATIPTGPRPSVDQRDPTPLAVNPSNDGGDALRSSLIDAAGRANAASDILMHDYITYHAVLVVAGGMAVLLLSGLSIACWRRVLRRSAAALRPSHFERMTYGWLGLLSTGSALGMLLIVAANLSTAGAPHAGFAHAFSELGLSHAGTHKAALYQAVTTWVQSDSPTVPSLLQAEVHTRLAWQRPKAIVCSILLMVFVVVTASIWHHVIRQSRTRDEPWGVKGKAQIMLGAFAMPGSLLLLIMALANTQAVFAPIMVTLLFN